jgi:chromosome segregation ATPase
LAQVEAQADELKKVIDSQLTALRRPREDIDRVGTRIGQIQLTQSTLPREIREAELQEVKLQEELKHLGALGVSLTGKANELDDKWREIRAALHLIDSGESQKDLPQLDAQLKKLNEDRALHQTAVDDTEREIVKLQAKEATARQKLVDHDQKGQSAPSRINKMKDEREVKIASIQSADADAEQLKSQLGALKKDRRITKKKLEAANVRL